MAESRTLTVVIAVPLAADDDPEQAATRLTEAIPDGVLANQRLGLVSYAVTDRGAHAALKIAVTAVDSERRLRHGE